MAELDTSPFARASKANSRLLQALAKGKQAAIAVAFGCDDTTIGRIRDNKLPDSLKLIYLLGFKVVPQSHTTIDDVELAGLEAKALRLMQYELVHGRLDAEEE